MSTLTRAALWAIVASAAFQGSNALVKAVGTALPSAEVGLFRAAGGVLLLALAARELAALRRLPDPGWHAVRGLLGALTLACLMHAFTTLPLALATTIYYARVLVMLPLARVMLGERASPSLWAAAVAGFAGLAIAVLPTLHTQPELGSGLAAILVATLASAGSQVAVTRLTRTNPPSAIVGVFAVVTMLALSLPASAVWQTPTASEALLLLGIGLAGAGAQVAVTRAYALAGAGFVAPFSYLEIPIAAAIGFVMAAELPTPHQAAGSLLVIAAAIYVTALGRRLTPPRRAIA